jgi:hypothetical protein
MGGTESLDKYILKLPNGGTLFVKELFDYSVNLYRCLVQTRYALTLTIEDKSRNKRVSCQNVNLRRKYYLNLLRSMGNYFS